MNTIMIATVLTILSIFERCFFALYTRFAKTSQSLLVYEPYST